MAPSKKRRTMVDNTDYHRYSTRSSVKQCDATSCSDNMGLFIGCLPPEMLTNVLSYLDAPSLACLGSTCKALYLYCDRMWKPLCNRLNLTCQPTILCVSNPQSKNSIYDYDNAVEQCICQRYKISAIRNWLYSRWKCVVCYRNGSQRVDMHVDITLCETCHSLFYRRKCHAKEQFSLTDKDLRIIDSESYDFLVSELITISRAKYGGREGLRSRLDERRQVKEKRESDKQCSLVQRESQVVSALNSLCSSYNGVSCVDARCMPYVSSPPTHPHVLQQSPEDAAKWLIACKNRQEARQKALLDQIKVRSERCKGCQAKVDHRLSPPSLKCMHITQAEAKDKMRCVNESFKEDIAHYSKHGLLYLEPGPYDIEEKSGQELMMRHERKCKLRKELDERKSSWPDILHGGKDPMLSQCAQDFIYKGVAHLENKGTRFQLRRAYDVARVTITRANGWDIRKKEVVKILAEKAIILPIKELRLQSQMLIDDYIESSYVVRGQHIVACSAAEVVEKVAIIEGHQKEQPSSVAQRCTRIYAECNPKPDFKSLQNQRKKDLLTCLKIKSLDDLCENRHACRQAANDFINCGTTTSLFGYKVNTPNSVAVLIKLKQQILDDKEKHGQPSSSVC